MRMRNPVLRRSKRQGRLASTGARRQHVRDLGGTKHGSKARHRSSRHRSSSSSSSTHPRRGQRHRGCPLQDADGEVSATGTYSILGSGTFSTGALGPWENAVAEAVLGSLAPTTRRAYQGALQAFFGFQEAQKGQAGPTVSETSLLTYLAHLREMGRSPTTMRSHLAAVSFYCKASGIPDTTGTFLVRQAIKGWVRMTPKVKDTRLPISLKLLANIFATLPHICSSPFEISLFRAAFSLAFFGAFRSGEIVSPSRVDCGDRPLQVGDVQVCGQTLLVRLRRSKTDQLAKSTCISMQASATPGPCPVKDMAAYSNIRPRKQGPFFLHADGSCLSRYQLAAILRLCLSAIHLPVASYGLHSFRIGAASTVSGLGAPVSRIMEVGRWRSKAYRTYIRPFPQH
ncbi:uncharacterized protein LOC125424902 [Sphaerodactylus townsendi]|uniref:uncharacterized protein LOC125424902 n=1 Tax=Sphaerodactylus townsendi TaxID=933632 RepID=UPI002026BA2C|nr:uncharacterized protein LOC125424902 [Sphaerodactylus townsendi]